MAKQRLADKVAIVTGASGGIGRAVACALAAEGADLVLASRNAQGLALVAKEIEALGRQALVVPVDVTSQTQVDQMIATALARWGRIDILVANAGAYVRSRVVTMTVQDVERAMAVNFYGALYGVLAVLPHMLARHQGHIVFVNTVDAKKGVPTDAPYVSSKSALAGFGAVLRQELYGTGVYVTSVFPGRVDTPMIADLRLPWISRAISPASVARSIVRSIHTRQLEIVIPPQALALVYLNTFSPRLADWAVRVFHLEGWKTKSAGSNALAQDGNSLSGVWHERPDQ